MFARSRHLHGPTFRSIHLYSLKWHCPVVCNLPNDHNPVSLKFQFLSVQVDQIHCRKRNENQRTIEHSVNTSKHKTSDQIAFNKIKELLQLILTFHLEEKRSIFPIGVSNTNAVPAVFSIPNFSPQSSLHFH